MGAFRIFLVCIFTAIVVYTVVVIANHGMGLFAVFFGDMAKMAWPGQFNLDFMGFLMLSGLWLAWRHHFSPPGSHSACSASSAEPPCSRRTSSSQVARRTETGRSSSWGKREHGAARDAGVG